MYPYKGEESIVTMTTTRVFQNGNSQALRIPQEMRTEVREYYISKVGDVIIAYPANDPWAPLRETAGTFPSDFLEDREQPMCSDLPERFL